MNQKVKKYIQIILKLLVSGFALFIVFRNTDTKELTNILQKSNPVLLLYSVFFFVLSKVVSAYRLNLFLKAEGIYVNPIVNLRLYLIGMFYNLFLPGGIGGDGYKVYYLRKNINTPIGKGIRALLFDRITGLFALIILCLIFASFSNIELFEPWVYVIAAIIITLSFYYIIYKWFKKYFRSLNITNVQSLAVQLSQVIVALLILKSIGQESKIVTYITIFLISSIVAVIPFTIGGAGARELTFLFSAKLYDLDISISIALSLLFFLITFFVSLGGIIYIMFPGLLKYKSEAAKL